MTKLKLNLAHGAGEILTREELKKVLGGTGSGSGSGGGCTCNATANAEQAEYLACTGTCPSISTGNGYSYQQQCRKAYDYEPRGGGSPLMKVVGAHCYCA